MIGRRERFQPEDGVAVVTGATSGVGKATALALARRGCRVVLVARSEVALEEAARECRAAGAAALAVPTDISDPDQVERLGDRALAEFGRIDLWVNAAAVLVAAPFGTETVAEARRLIDVNIFGTLLCSRRALEIFGAQERGVLVNVSSLLGLVPNPLVPDYVMSKFAVRGLTLALRHAAAATPGVEVGLVMPGPVDTPMFASAANHTGRDLRAIPPACAPERVAAAVLAAARSPRRPRTAGLTSRLMVVAHRIGPRATEWSVARYSATALLRRGTTVAPTTGNLFSPQVESRISGNWRAGEWRRDLGARLGRLAART